MIPAKCTWKLTAIQDVGREGAQDRVQPKGWSPVLVTARLTMVCLVWTGIFCLPQWTGSANSLVLESLSNPRWSLHHLPASSLVFSFDSKCHLPRQHQLALLSYSVGRFC